MGFLLMLRIFGDLDRSLEHTLQQAPFRLEGCLKGVLSHQSLSLRSRLPPLKQS